MRVLTVSNLYPPLYAGGYEIICRGVVDSLRSEGHTVRVLVGATRSEGIVDDHDVHRELHSYWNADGVDSLGLPQRLQLERKNASTLRRHLREFAPDVVSWWGMGGMSLSLVERVRRAGIPAVAFVCDDWLHYGLSTDLWLRMFAHRRGLARVVETLTRLPTNVDWASAARYVFVSESLRREAPPLPKTDVEHPGIDEQFLVPHPSQTWAWRLLTIGRIDARKGIATAIAALATLPEASLTIAGSGPEEEVQRLRDIAQSHGVQEQITWLGAVGRGDLPQLYARHDAVLFPVVWNEPFGLVPLEAMGVGRPVAATGRGGSGEYLRDGVNCLLHPPQDADALSATVRRLGTDDALRSHLRDEGLLTARRYTSARYGRAAIIHLQRAVADASDRPLPRRAAGSH